jgi:hypothetical protein
MVRTLQHVQTFGGRRASCISGTEAERFGFSPEQAANITMVFDVLDKDNSNSIEKDECIAFCEGDERRGSMMMKEMDVDDSGHVSSDEWKLFFQKLSKSGTLEEDLSYFVERAMDMEEEDEDEEEELMEFMKQFEARTTAMTEKLERDLHTLSAFKSAITVADSVFSGTAPPGTKIQVPNLAALEASFVQVLARRPTVPLMPNESLAHLAAGNGKTLGVRASFPFVENIPPANEMVNIVAGVKVQQSQQRTGMQQVLRMNLMNKALHVKGQYSCCLGQATKKAWKGMYNTFKVVTYPGRCGKADTIEVLFKDSAGKATRLGQMSIDSNSGKVSYQVDKSSRSGKFSMEVKVANVAVKGSPFQITVC